MIKTTSPHIKVDMVEVAKLLRFKVVLTITPYPGKAPTNPQIKFAIPRQNIS